MSALKKHPPVTGRFFASYQLVDLLPWAKEAHATAAAQTEIWVQVGILSDAVEVATATRPDIFVLRCRRLEGTV